MFVRCTGSWSDGLCDLFPRFAIQADKPYLISSYLQYMEKAHSSIKSKIANQGQERLDEDSLYYNLITLNLNWIISNY